jgi:hypothetical protein
MFFALCHALGDSISFLKVPNMNKIIFRQDEQIFAVNITGTTTQNFDDTHQQQQQSTGTPTTGVTTAAAPASSSVFLPHMTSIASTTTDTSATTHYQPLPPPPPPQNGNDSNHTTTTNTLAAAAAAAANFFSVSDQTQQHILQAALSSVGPHDSEVPAVPNAATLPTTSPTTAGVRRRGNTEKRSKKPSPRDKEYAIRRK